VSTLRDRIAALPPERRRELERRLLALRDPVQDPEIRSREWTGPCRLSFAQERLWFLDQLLPGTPLYNMPVTIEIDGPLNIDALHRALDALAARHSSLRTRYASTDGIPWQTVDPAVRVEFNRVEAQARSAGEIGEIALEAASRPFDLTRDAMLRATVLEMGRERSALLLNMPHIAGDGWSYNILFRELAELYGASQDQRQCPLPALAIEYRDFAAWQREHLSGEVAEREFAFWRRQLDGARKPELPVDAPAPAVPLWRGSIEKIRLPASVAEALSNLGAEQFATPFMTLLAGGFLLLHELTATDDILIGTPAANRSRVELEGLVGLFVNTILLRQHVEPRCTFRTLLDEVRRTAIEAQQHQELPFEKLVTALQPVREWDSDPYVSVLFSWGNSIDEISLPGLTTRLLPLESGTAKFDLWFRGYASGDGLTLAVEYRSRSFRRETAQRLLRRFATLMEAAAADPDRELGALQDGDTRPRAAAGVALPTRNAYPRKSIPELFQEQVLARPSAIALAAGLQRVTYAELNRRANRVAHRLLMLGAAPESCVGIMLPRSIDAIVAMLGILKAGAAYVPLDPSFPPERLRLLASDSGMRLAVTWDQYRDRTPAGVDPMFPGSGGACDESDPQVGVGPENLAAVFYTSGSTGRPKGVAIPHRGIVHLLFGVDYARFGPDEVFLHVAPPSFDAATFEIWGALLHGGCCAVYSEGVPSPHELGLAIRQHCVTTLWLTAALFNFIVDEDPAVLRPVRQLLAGGEALSVPHVRRALEQLPGTALTNGYGPTEGTTFTCCYRIPRELPADLGSIPIGRPIGGAEVFILNEHCRPAPAGSPGELYIGGPGVARGYLNRDDLTRERFIDNPFGGRGRLYRTGDLVRELCDGNIEFLGRLDNQVKIRGHRIEPGEVEAVLMAHPGVRTAAVVPDEAPGGDCCLAAYVARQPESATSEADLWEYLRVRLPAYMIPSRILVVEQMPLNPNGKLDRSALRRCGAALPVEIAVTDDTESKLVAIWKELLQSDRIGPDSNFFESGGHSLLALQLADRIGKAFARKPPLVELLRAATIRSMARLLRDGWTLEPSGPLVPIRTRGVRPPLFGVHDVRGRVLLFASLSPYLGSDQPVYGLQPHTLRAPQTAAPRIQDLAAEYVAAIRSVQPAGPYRLAGACFGGVVAFEMARQLETLGEPVDFLALIDAFAPRRLESMSWVREWRARLRSTRARVMLHFRNLARMGPAESVHYLERSCHTLRRRLGDRLWALGSRCHLVSGAAGTADVHAAERAAYCALRRYVPQPYGGTAILFRAKERSRPQNDSYAGWTGLIGGGIELCEIPGDHLTMLSHPNRLVLAQELARRLDRMDIG
jgi:amino acid adenylation domain-containing protein